MDRGRVWVDPFVGRAGEMEQLSRRRDEAMAGRGRTVVIVGAAGIGKSRLLDEFTAATVVPVCSARAVERVAAPLRVWRRVLSGLAGGSEVLERELAALQAADDVRGHVELFDAVCDFLEAAAEPAGLVVALEDLHWADQLSLALLSHLDGEVQHSRLLVVATCRPSAVTGPLASLLGGSRIELVELAGLSLEDVRLYVEAVTGSPPDDPVALHASTRGNPLYLRTAVRAGGDTGGGPASLETAGAAARWLEHLEPEAGDLLRAASVLGTDFDLHVLAAMRGLTPDEAVAILAPAERAGVVLDSPRRVGFGRFAHDVIRDGVYALLAGDERLQLHRRAADALASTARSDDASIAAHLLQAAVDNEGRALALDRAKKAAATAAAQLAWDDARGWYESAAGLSSMLGITSEHGRLLVELARAEYHCGLIDDSIEHCVQAADLSGRHGDGDGLAAAALVVHGVNSAPHNATIGQLCDRALVAVRPDDLATRAHLLAQRASAAAAVGDLTLLDARSAEALEQAEASGHAAALVAAIRARHAACVAPERVGARLELAERALRLADGGGPPMAALWGRLWRIDAAFLTGDAAAVDAELLQLESVVGRVRWRLGQWHLSRLRAVQAALAGRFPEATEAMSAARELADRLGDPSAKALSRSFTAQLARLRGIPEDVPGDLFATFTQGPRLGVTRAAAAAAYLLVGDRDKALDLYVELRDQAVTLPTDAGRLSFLALCADLACAFDDAEHAPTLSRLMAPYATYLSVGTAGVVFCLGAMAGYLGRLSLLRGRLDDAERQLTSAIAINAAAGAQPYVALSRVDLAQVLARRGRGDDLVRARALAADGLATMQRLGMPGPQRITGDVIAGIDAAAARASTLTIREREIARLVGDGLSNADIAGRLVLSERTVESHVRNILIKLDGTTRADIREWVHHPGRRGHPASQSV